MIVTEIIIINGKEFTRTYSDADSYIKKVGTDEIYFEAVDPIEIERVYEETNEIIEEIAEFTAEEALDIIVGGEGV